MSNLLLSSHPVEIYQALDTLFADDAWISWEPETLLLELKEEVPEAAVDKLLAVQALAANSELALTHSQAFENVVNAFCNNICVTDTHQPPYVEEMAYAVSQIEKIVKLVHGENTPCKFTGDVPNYVAATARFRDWFALPRILSFAQEMLNSLTGAGKERLVLDVLAFYGEMTRQAARNILADGELSSLTDDTPGAVHIRRILGALLFDPTLPYARNTH